MSKTPPTPGDGPSVEGPFNEVAAKPAVDLGQHFRQSHRVPPMEPDFDKAAEQEDPAKHLSKPAPTLTPKGTRLLPKKQPTLAIANVNPTKIPKTLPDKALPRKQQFQKKAVCRHAAEVPQKGRHEDGNGREQ